MGNNPSQKIAVASRILNFILARGWTDYDDFSSTLARRILAQSPITAGGIIKEIEEFDSPFFSLNNIPKKVFVQRFPIDDIVKILEQTYGGPLTFIDIFPETEKVDIATGRRLIPRLDIEETLIQNAIRDSLRERNVTNPIDRGRDSALEVGDHEHFLLKVNGTHRSFAGVVKGYRSLGGSKTANWEKIAHQVVKAYNRTNPDYVLLVLAKNPADSVLSELQRYSDSINKPNLIVLCDPLNLARFLAARGVISDSA